MDKEEMEKIVRLFTGVQECNDTRTAFLKGIIFGLGFIDFPEPNWEIIKKMIKEGEDRIGWLCLEKETFDINKKLKKDQVNHPHLKVWACSVRDVGNRLIRRHTKQLCRR